MADQVDLTIVTLSFVARTDEPGAAERLAGLLARYVVVSRAEPGCRNIDLCHSGTHPGRFLVIEKWETPTDQRAHFDSPTMLDMARSVLDLLAAKPEVDLLDAISAHDLT